MMAPQGTAGLLLLLSLVVPGSPTAVMAEDATTTRGFPPEQRAVTDHLLTTTRTVRKRLDLSRPVEPEIIEEAIDIAFQAPTGSNRQGWHFVVVTDPAKKNAIADAYRRGMAQYAMVAGPQYAPGDLRVEQGPRIGASAAYLAQHIQEVPVLVIAVIEGRVEDQSPAAQASLYGSILPAGWSFMLALRARGLGSAWTTLHLIHEKEVAKALGIPDSMTQAALFPVAYYTGTDFKPAKRLPAKDRTHWNQWGQRRP